MLAFLKWSLRWTLFWIGVLLLAIAVLCGIPGLWLTEYGHDDE